MTPATPRQPCRVALIAAVLFLLVGAALWPVLSAGFVHWDDYQYIVDNPRVTRGLSLTAVVWAFTTDHSHNWHPLTWLSHQLDVTGFGLDPRGHHLTSLLLHGVNTVLLFLGLRAYTGGIWRSAGTAALFGVHPLHVESVAWVSERKDLLAALFFLLTLLAYLRHARAPDRRRFWPVIVLFALGLMAKPMLVTLPFVLLLLDGWPLQRLRAAAGWGGARRALVEKVPLLLLSAAASLVTILVQRGVMTPVEVYPVAQRAANALVSYARYLGRTLSGVDLSVLDLLPEKPWPAGPVLAAAALLGLLSLTALLSARRRPFLAVGWLWFLGMLVPVIGLVQVGRQALADRYTYLPLIGLFLAAVWGAGEIASRSRRLKATVGAVAVFAVVVLAAQARGQAAIWHDDFTLFGHAVQVDPANGEARNNLGTAFARNGDLKEALRHFQLALAAQPKDEKAWYNIGHTLEMQGLFPPAVPYLTQALSLRPDYPAAAASLGAVLLELGRNREAGDHLAAAWRLDPGNPGVAINLAVAHERLGDRAEARRWYRETLRLAPDNARAARALGSDRRHSTFDQGGKEGF